MSGPVTRRALASVFLRSFAIQGSWNYRTMLGGGVSFAMIPIVRELVGGDRDAASEILQRHAEGFNAHPYLANLALGAIARLEAEGESPETIRRFKKALGGPLGGLGDSLVWAAWLPTVLLGALLLAWAGAPPLVVILGFLLTYNVGHLALRAWGFTLGWAEGKQVVERLSGARLGPLADRISAGGALLLGLGAGILVMTAEGFGDGYGSWIILAALAFGVGLWGGVRVWRPTAIVTVVAVAGIIGLQLLFGVFS